MRNVMGSGATVLRRIQTLGFKSGLAFSADRLREQGGSIQIPGYRGRVTYRTGVDPFILEHVFIESNFAACVEHLSPGIIVDAGAHAGFASVYFARQFPAARILSIEPDADNFAALCRNAEPYPFIEPIHAALWNTSGHVRIVNEDANSVSFRVDQCEATAPGAIPAISMTDVIARFGGQRIGLLKLDIEGAERELFQQPDRAWLDWVDAIAIELHDAFQPGASRAFYTALGDRPFDQFITGDKVLVVFRPQKVHEDAEAA